MTPVIRVSDELYSRLEKHARGFDTPAAVIEKLLNRIEGKPVQVPKPSKPTYPHKPQLVFHPADEKQFLKQLIERKAAWVKIDYQDGSSETIPWHASRMKPTSNLRANIWSGQLRDWKAKGIVKAEFFIDRGDIQAPV